MNHLKGNKAIEKPIHERLDKIRRQKQEYLFKLRTEAEESNSELTFKPQINPTSDHIANQKKERGDVTERLIQAGHDKAENRTKAAKNYEEEISKVCTFKPIINPISDSSGERLGGNDSTT